MKLEIITPETQIFSGNVTSVTLPGKLGFFTLWEDHAPLISSLAAGKMRYVSEGKETEIEIDGGFAEVNKNKVIVCLEIV
ncbi:MAG TPA: ATP synthase F1 subunit epsilon [Paludibacter sp.]|nr:ATP synthase F1 subunit epsilon [Paludibacter sp.]